MSERQFPAIATVERDTVAFVIPHPLFQRWIGDYEPWRSFVFHLLAQRLAMVMAILDEVAFRRMDVRVAEFLLRSRPADGAPLVLTHQQIAAELGSAREVVSRILADFASAGQIQLGRGSMTILDPKGLERRMQQR